MPILWDTLKQVAINPQILIYKPSIIYRTSVIQTIYNEYLKQGEDKICDIISKRFGSENFTVIENAFPYDVGNGILHYLIFVKPSTTLSTEFINRLVTGLKVGFNKTESLCFEMPSLKRSLPCLQHFHIFLK